MPPKQYAAGSNPARGARETNISATVFASRKPVREPIARASSGEEREAAQASLSVQHAKHGDTGSMNRT
jgi:hypothetical protein